MEKNEEARNSTKDMLENVLPLYQEKINHNFDLDDVTKEKLTELYNKTSEEVLKTSLINYQMKLLKQKEKNEPNNFTIEVPVITKTKLTKNERLYLLYLYIDKLVEYDFESLGLTSVDIIKKYISYKDIEEDKIYDIEDTNRPSDNSYSLKLVFSLIKKYIETNYYNDKIKVYSTVAED